MIFWALLLLLLIDRVVLLWRFGSQYTDNDQVLFWMGARDYAHGIFHEPCLYGQNYNYMLESLLAAPFLRLGLPCWWLLPAVTSALALAPYVALGFGSLRRNLPAASVFVALPLPLPPEYGMHTMMTHGVVTGLCVLALFPLLERFKCPRKQLSFAGMVAALALCLNPNAAPAAAALLLVMLLRAPLRPALWLYPLLGAMPFLILNYLTSIYYAAHPPIHELSGGALVFRPGLWLDGMKHLDLHFAWLCPLFWGHGSFVLILLLALTATLAAGRKWAEAGALLAGLVMLVAALGLPKTHDGNSSVGYAYSRMFLAAPLLCGIGFSFCSPPARNLKPALLVLLLVCGGATVLRNATLEAVIRRQTANQPPPLSMRRVRDVRRECASIDSLCRGKIELVVALPPVRCSYADASFYCVAGEMLFPDYPRTLIYGFDRRSWRTEAEMAAVSTNILFIGGGSSGWQQLERHDPGISEAGDGMLFLHQMRNAKGWPLREVMRELKPLTESHKEAP